MSFLRNRARKYASSLRIAEEVATANEFKPYWNSMTHLEQAKWKSWKHPMAASIVRMRFGWRAAVRLVRGILR